METIYYTLDARRVSRFDMASGEAAPICRQYAVLRPRDEPHEGAEGKILDFAAYRRALTAPEEEEYDQLHPAPKAALSAKPESTRTGLVLDILATVGILTMAAVVILAFVPFLLSF